MRKLLLAIFFIIVAGYILNIYLDTKVIVNQEVMEYYIANAYRDTWAKNPVTAIYLNYRMFDSIFETLMLLACATAVIYFSRRKDHG